VSIPIRTSLLAILCLCRLPGATAPDHPLYFEERQSGLFETRAAGQSVTIRADSIAIDGVTLRFLHSSQTARLKGSGRPAPSTYITRDGTIHFLAYPKAGARHLYPGIDVAFYGHPGQLEYDLDLALGAKPDRIRIDVSGARRVRLDEHGNLIIDTRSGELRQLAPRVFQANHGVRQEIPAHYVLLSTNQIGFELGKHDPGMPLTIDPVIVYTKYFGGSDFNTGGPVATDAQGNVYVTGGTNSIDFPSTNGTKVRLQPPLLAYSNAGQTVKPLPVGTATSVTAIAGTPDGNVLYVATPNGIFVSGDGGASFTQAVPLMNASGNAARTVQAISVDAVDPSRAFIATAQGLFVMTGAGQSTGEDDPGMATAGNGAVNATAVQVSSVNHLVMYATTATPNNFLYTSTDAGASWQQLYPSYSGEAPAGPYTGNSITFTLAPGGSDLYVIDGNGVFFKSPDGGMTWQKVSGHYLLNPKSITIDPNNLSNIYVVDGAGVERSTDGGTTFTTISPSLPPGVYVQSFALDSSTGDLYLATYSQIDVSVNQGATWKALPPRLNPHVVLGLGNQVFAGVDSPTVPFVVKWSPDGSQLLYSTFFGGSFSDSITAITVDAQGEAIIAGNTASSDFPVTQAISAASPTGIASGFVAKLSADGSQAIYSSIIGASLGVTVNGLTIDATGAPYITGATPSPDFPITAGVPQPKLPTAMCQRTTTDPFLLNGDLGTYAFVSKLSANASSLVYSTFLTGACGSVGQGIAVDTADEAVVVGLTTSPDFPVTTGAYQSTFPGGAAASITYPNPINFGFVTKLNAAGSQAIASSFIGGGFLTEAYAVALDASGDPYITGSTWGITPGATPGAYQTKVKTGCPPVINIGPGPEYPSGGSDAFVLKLNPTLSSAHYLTYLGGVCDDSGSSIVLDPTGNVWLGGSPAQGFPLVTPYELGGTGSKFVSELSADFSQLLFSSFADGSNLAIDPSGAIYVSGSSGSKASLVKIDPAGTPPVIINSIEMNSTIQAPSPFIPFQIAPGELINIVGQNLGPANTVMAQLDATGHLPYLVGATSVSFGEYSAPLISVQDNLIVCFSPFEISGSTQLTVKVDGQSSNSALVSVVPSAPYVLEIVNRDGSINSANHPAPQGSVVTVYVTGLGLTSPLSQDGSVSAPPLPVPVATVTVDINGNQLQPQFAGAADGMIAGLTQVNVQIPVATYSSNPVSAFINNALAQIYIGQ
jgi:uncharacterized protein (TIGR03437 family)